MIRYERRERKRSDVVSGERRGGDQQAVVFATWRRRRRVRILVLASEAAGAIVARETILRERLRVRAVARQKAAGRQQGDGEQPHRDAAEIDRPGWAGIDADKSGQILLRLQQSLALTSRSRSGTFGGPEPRIWGGRRLR